MQELKIRGALKQYIIELLKQKTNKNNPFFFLKWSGLNELTKSYGIDLIELIDEMVKEGLIGKALIRKKLAIYLPENKPYISKKFKELKEEFEEFLKKCK